MRSTLILGGRPRIRGRRPGKAAPIRGWADPPVFSLTSGWGSVNGILLATECIHQQPGGPLARVAD